MTSSSQPGRSSAAARIFSAISPLFRYITAGSKGAIISAMLRIYSRDCSCAKPKRIMVSHMGFCRRTALNT